MRVAQGIDQSALLDLKTVFTAYYEDMSNPSAYQSSIYAMCVLLCIDVVGLDEFARWCRLSYPWSVNFIHMMWNARRLLDS